MLKKCTYMSYAQLEMSILRSRKGPNILKKYACYAQEMFLLQWVLAYPNPDYLNAQLSERLNVAMILAVAGKGRSGHWSSATGESKDAV